MSDDGLEEIRVGAWETAAPLYVEVPLKEGPSGRVPHLGHALLFLAISGLLLIVSQAVLLLPVLHGGSALTVSLQHPKLLLASEGLTYVLALGVSWLVFPLMWHRSFLAGLDWNGAKALELAAKLIPLGILSGWTVQAISSLISMPKSIPMDSFFKSTSDVWIVTFFGTLLAPLFEETCFRGFLLPAFSIAFDWLGPVLRYLFNFPASRLRGEMPPEHVSTFREARSAGVADDMGNMAFRSQTAIVLASLLTSGMFGLLHAQQLGYTWSAVLLLTAVSLLLTVVRLRTRSVACSTLVHGSYNFSVFLVLFFATGGYRHLERMGR